MNRRHIRRSSYNSGVMRSTKKTGADPVRPSGRQSGASEAGGGHYNYITGAGADETGVSSSQQIQPLNLPSVSGLDTTFLLLHKTTFFFPSVFFTALRKRLRPFSIFTAFNTLLRSSLVVFSVNSFCLPRSFYCVLQFSSKMIMSNNTNLVLLNCCYTKKSSVYFPMLVK